MVFIPLDYRDLLLSVLHVVYSTVQPTLDFHFIIFHRSLANAERTADSSMTPIPSFSSKIL